MPKDNTREQVEKSESWSMPQIAAMIVLGAVLALMVLLVAGDLINFRTTGRLSPRHHARDLLNLISPSSQNALPAPNLAYIQTWMTFDYLNKAFKLPPDYLKLKLNITDSRYPNLSIRHLTDDMKTDPNAVLAEIRAAISQRPAATSTRP